MANKHLILLSFLSLLLVANHGLATNKAEGTIELVTNKPEAIGYEGRQSHTRLREARQCRLQQISVSQPRQSIQSEGGVTEFWDENEDQFQCTGVAAMRNIIQPNSLSLPNYSPSPRLVYIERGRGLLGVTFPGCPETYQSSRDEQSYRGSSRRGDEQSYGGSSRRGDEQSYGGSSRRGDEQSYGGSSRRGDEQSYRGSEGSRGEQEELRSGEDQHQKIHRVRGGDLVVLPAGVAHWCLNDGKEDLVAVSVNDLNNQANQLDQKLRSYYLAGSQNQESQRGQSYESQRGSQKGPQQGSGESDTYQNILNPFDENLMADALNVDVETVRNMRKEDGRGYIVKVREDMSVIRPDEDYEGYDERERGERRYIKRREGSRGTGERRYIKRREGSRGTNGLEETICTARIHHYLDNPREADVYSRDAGRLNIVNMLKLPILSYLDLSAEKGELLPNAIHAPHWLMNAHSIFYITRGEAQVQVVGNNGQSLLDDKVNEGDIFTVPQYFAATFRAGSEGVEWVAFRTSALPISNPVAGSTSVFRGMPAQVIAESYGIGLQEAQNIKYGRQQHTLLLPPGRRSSH